MTPAQALQGRGERHARRDEVLEYVVERGRVAHARLYDRSYVVVAQHSGMQHTLAGFHPHAVALYGIDFTVVTELF